MRIANCKLVLKAAKQLDIVAASPDWRLSLGAGAHPHHRPEVKGAGGKLLGLVRPSSVEAFGDCVAVAVELVPQAEP
mgnify:CR=1 FL=1